MTTITLPRATVQKALDAYERFRDADDLDGLDNAIVALRDALEQPQQYQQRNPLGGPAKVFDAMADEIRAGGDYHAVLLDYGYAEQPQAEQWPERCASAPSCACFDKQGNQLASCVRKRLDHPQEPVLPYDVSIDGMTFGKGVPLSTFVAAAARWRREAYPPLTQEQKDANLAKLQNIGALATGAALAAPPQQAEPAPVPQPGMWRKKPVVVSAVQMTMEVAAAHLFEKAALPAGVEFAGASHKNGKINHFHSYIETLEGRMDVSLGDWIITGVKGERYPCKDDIFRLTYEPASAPAPSESDALALLREAHSWITEVRPYIPGIRDRYLLRLRDNGADLVARIDALLIAQMQQEDAPAASWTGADGMHHEISPDYAAQIAKWVFDTHGDVPQVDAAMQQEAQAAPAGGIVCRWCGGTGSVSMPYSVAPCQNCAPPQAAQEPAVEAQAPEWVLYEHHDGRYAAAPSVEAARAFTEGEPQWHLLGPVAVQAPDGVEPVAWFRIEDGVRIYYATKAWDDLQPLYTRPAVTLTDDDIDATMKIGGFPNTKPSAAYRKFARAILARAGIGGEA